MSRAGRGKAIRPISAGTRTEATLVTAVFCCIGLVLVTPLVVTSSTYFPFVVGKALYARVTIEVAFGLWATLALLAPTYRPRRSAILMLLAAGFVAAVVSALAGVSPQRSVWSNFERMQGVVETAHWAAFTLVAACMLRTHRHWIVLFNCCLAVGAVVALLAIIQYFDATGIPMFGNVLAGGTSRPGATLGNPIYLSTFLLLNVVLAGGLLVRSFVAMDATSSKTVRGRSKKRKRRSSSGRRPVRRSHGRSNVYRSGSSWQVFWAAIALVHLWAASLTASLGPLLGVLFGVGTLALVSGFLARSQRNRRIAIGATCVLAVLVALPLLLPDQVSRELVKPVDSRLLNRVVRLDLDTRTIRTRLTAWRAGFDGFADRPLLGWGPENFLVAFGRHARDFPERTLPHDTAHSAFFNELATKGAVGTCIYLAMWAATAVILLRTARRTRGRERVLVLAVGTALAAYFASTQSLFATSVGSMQYAFLLAFVIRHEMSSKPTLSDRRIRPGRVHVALGVLLWCLVAAGLWTNRAIFEAGRTFLQASTSPLDTLRARDRYDAAIAAFEPLAGEIRWLIFIQFVQLLHGKPILAMSLLPWIDSHAVRAIGAEPENWLLRLQLALLYANAATKAPERLPDAKRQVSKLFELAPARDGVLSLFDRPPQPQRLRSSIHEVGIRLTWKPVSNALIYRVAQRIDGGSWQRIHEGVSLEAILSPPIAWRTLTYRVKACLGPGNCGRWSAPLLLSETDGEDRVMPKNKPS